MATCFDYIESSPGLTNKDDVSTESKHVAMRIFSVTNCCV